MLKYLIVESLAALFGGIIIVIIAIKFVPWRKLLKFLKKVWFWVLLFIVMFFIGMFANATYPPNFALPPWMQTKAPAGPAPALPMGKIIQFFTSLDEMERVDDIGANPNDVPPPTERTEPALVKIDITAQEVVSEISPGIFFNYWTYDQQVPGPMYRVRVGDTVEVTLHNHETSLHPHNIDLHAVTGPGGGTTLSTAKPGESKGFRWKALAPGLFVYHCATPNIATHNAHGQYGLILVEPEEGLPQVDKEFYVMQGEVYTEGKLGKKGLVAFDSQALLDGIPNYVTFNGKVETESRMKVETGDKVRIYVGNGGTNLISSFHVIGEIFDTVYPEAAIGNEPHKNVQTTAVLPGGASIVEFTAEVPGNLILVDHALARMNKGAWAIMEVEGEERPDIYAPIE